MDLLKKGPQRFIEADGMETMLQRGGMHLGLCRIDQFFIVRVLGFRVKLRLGFS